MIKNTTSRGRAPRPCATGAPLTALTTLAALLSGAMLLLGGCANPGPRRPNEPLTETRTVGATDATTPWPEKNWWAAYGDPALDKLVAQALAGTPTLKTAEVPPMLMPPTLVVPDRKMTHQGYSGTQTRRELRRDRRQCHG